MIAFYEARLTGDEGLGTSGEGPGTGNGDVFDETAGNGSATVSQSDADVVITWAWGENEVVGGFDPADGTIFIDWIGAADLEVAQTADGVVFSVASNQQTTTLLGVSLAELSAANFTILDAGTAAKVRALIGDGAGNPVPSEDPDVPEEPETPSDPDLPAEPSGPEDPERQARRFRRKAGTARRM